MSVATQIWLLNAPDASTVKRRRDRAVLVLMGYHGLRVSTVVGLDLDAIARALGHSSVTATQVYTDTVDRAAENPTQFHAGALLAVWHKHWKLLKPAR